MMVHFTFSSPGRLTFKEKEKSKPIKLIKLNGDYFFLRHLREPESKFIKFDSLIKRLYPLQLSAKLSMIRNFFSMYLSRLFQHVEKNICKHPYEMKNIWLRKMDTDEGGLREGD